MAEDDVLESINVRIERLDPSEKAEEWLYTQRLEECKNCEHLISGVCMKCGCYVEFRAAFKRNSCPYVRNRRW